MKKKLIFALALCLLMVLSACGQVSIEELQASVPSMAVISGSQQVRASLAGGDWTYKKSSFVADGANPLFSEQTMTDLKESSSVSAAAGEEVGMYFSVLPDAVTVTYWSADTAVEENGAVPAGETVEVSYGNDVFSFIMPVAGQDTVMVATATWSSHSDRSGTMDYYFIVTQG